MAEVTGGTLPTSEVQAVLASTEYSASYEAEEAFNGSIISRETDRWVSVANYNITTGLPNSGNGEWYQFQFVSALKILKFKLITGIYPKTAPKKVTFYTSDTGAFAGEEINCGDYTLSVEPDADDWTPWYMISSPTSALYLRLEINSLWPGLATGFCIIPEIVPFKFVPKGPFNDVLRPKHIITPFPVLGGV